MMRRYDRQLARVGMSRGVDVLSMVDEEDGG